MCLPNILFPVFMFAFIFHWPSCTPFWLLLAERSLLAASISHFLTATLNFHVFRPMKIHLLCFQSLALALSLLST